MVTKHKNISENSFQATDLEIKTRKKKYNLFSLLIWMTIILFENKWKIFFFLHSFLLSTSSPSPLNCFSFFISSHFMFSLFEYIISFIRPFICLLRICTCFKLIVSAFSFCFLLFTVDLYTFFFLFFFCVYLLCTVYTPSAIYVLWMKSLDVNRNEMYDNEEEVIATTFTQLFTFLFFFFAFFLSAFSVFHRMFSIYYNFRIKNFFFAFGYCDCLSTVCHVHVLLLDIDLT